MWFWMIKKLEAVLKKKINLKENPLIFSISILSVEMQDRRKKSGEKYKTKVTLFSIKYLSDIF